MKPQSALTTGLLLLAWGVSAPAQPPDAAAAEALLKQRGCFACHGVAQKKDGPSFKGVAAKYKDKGKAGAEKELFTHLTTNMPIKLSGRDARHVSLKGATEAEVRNAVRWILSR